MAKELYIQTFGKFSVAIDSVEVKIPFKRSQKAQEIMRFFLAYRNRKISKDYLCDEFWPGMDYYSAKHNLSTTLYMIRKGFDEVYGEKGFGKKLFRSSSQMCWFETPGEVSLDISLFRQLIKKASLTAKKEEKIKIYKEVEELYNGDFLSEQPYSEWAISIREECKELSVETLIELVKLLIEQQSYKEAKLYQSKAIKIDPYNENLILQKMLILKEQKLFVEAIKTFETFERNLMEEFGFKPSPNLENLRDQIILCQESTEKKKNLAQEIKDERYVELSVFKKIIFFELSQRQCDSALMEININIDWTNIPWLFNKIFNCMVSLLRKGDLITHNDKSFFILLKNITEENITIVAERLISNSLINELFGSDKRYLDYKTYILDNFNDNKKELLKKLDGTIKILSR
jgi:DNA-binding SARP family transcriptional activator